MGDLDPFHRCPPEIRRHIVNFAGDSLASLRLVSHEFTDLVSPLLFRTICVGSKDFHIPSLGRLGLLKCESFSGVYKAPY